MSQCVKNWISCSFRTFLFVLGLHIIFLVWIILNDLKMEEELYAQASFDEIFVRKLLPVGD